MTLNGVHTIVSYLDIFEKVGKAVAHDEYVRQVRHLLFTFSYHFSLFHFIRSRSE